MKQIDRQPVKIRFENQELQKLLTRGKKYSYIKNPLK